MEFFKKYGIWIIVAIIIISILIYLYYTNKQATQQAQLTALINANNQEISAIAGQASGIGTALGPLSGIISAVSLL